MIVAFKFTYMNKTPFLAYFLDFYAKKSALDYNLIKDENEITLYVNAEEKELLRFSDEYINLVPNSVFLAKSSVEVVESVAELNLDRNFTIPTAKFANTTPSVIKNYTAKGEILANEYDVLSEISVLKDGEFEAVTKENFYEMVEFCFLNLLHNQKLNLKEKNLDFELKSGLNFGECDFVMPTNFTNLSKGFVVDNKSLIALASFEKPIINLKLSAIFRQNHPSAPLFYDVRAASDLFIFAVFERLAKEEVFFVSAKIPKDWSEQGEFKLFKITVAENSFVVVNHGEFISNDEAKFLKEKNFSNFALLGLICNEFSAIDKKNISISLNKGQKDSIKLYDKQNVIELLSFTKFSSFDEVKDEIESDETGKKLYANFSKEFKFPKANIEKSDSFYTLFDMASQIIFGKDADYILESAKDFLGTKGPRIDFLLKDGREFDTGKFIRSGMSYKLAGVSDKILSYGYIESFVYFISDFLDDIKGEIGFDNSVFSGLLFEEKNILNLIEKVVSKELNIKFSNYLGLEAR